ncbi:MAG: hypothetical protein HQL28_07070 [Candidatus Omnitrophica bacterium]|nr:hypothetical protein [Candidatus Omnitrophota bacterium]
MRPKILLIDGDFRKEYYTDIHAAFDAEWISVNSPAFLDKDTGFIDLAMVSDERAIPYAAHTVAELKRRNIPTLHVSDGILEWRNVWENPMHKIGVSPAMPLFQPVLCHKIACIGRSQARILESWGNLGKCEVVGFPRFDKLLDRKKNIGTGKVLSGCKSLTFLVMTARTAAFTAEQIEIVKRSLIDLKTWFSKNGIVNA